ncbi:MAG: sulfatase [Leptospirales bacterium]
MKNILIKKTFTNLAHAFLAGSVMSYILIYTETIYHFHSAAMAEFFTPAFLFSYMFYLIGFLYLLVPLFLFFLLFEYLIGKLHAILKNRETAKGSQKNRALQTLKRIAHFKQKRIHHVITFITVIVFWQMADNSSLLVSDRFFTVIILLSILFFAIGTTFITRAGFIFVILLLLISFAKHFGNNMISSGNSQKNIPNVLLIVSDTTRQDHMTFYGYERDTTPNMKKLADKGVVFENAFSTSAWTKPATASLVTSQPLTDDTVHNGAYPIAYQGTFMAEYFSSKGYETALISANSNASSFFGHAKGYKYRMHSMPPEHTAFHKFITIRFFENTFHGKAFSSLKNNSISLKEYADYLNLSLSQLNDFLNEKIEPGIKLTAEETAQYRKIIHNLIDKQAADELRKFPNILPISGKWYTNVLNSWYKNTLYFFYFVLEDSEGEIVNYWLKDKNVTNKFMDWHKNIKPANKPFFVHLQIMGPHTPYYQQLPYLLPYFGAEYVNQQYSPPTQHTPPSQPAPRMGPRKLESLIANYDNAIRITDANLGRVIEYLKQAGELDNTIIVFVADHGESFYEHNIYGHMNSLHAELIDIPLFFYWKNKIAPARIDRPASILDIFPTLINLTNLLPDKEDTLGLKGESLFHVNLTPLTDKREDFMLPVFTIVGSAWKLKRTNGLPFGLHSAVITPYGKLVKENEETGVRYMFFEFGDKIEKREFYDIEHPGLSESIQRLKKLLPTEPERWKLRN